MDQPPLPANAPDQLDGAWKCALDWLLDECLNTCFPAVAARLDWSRPFVPVDTELHQPADGTTPAASACHADRVLHCHTRDGGAVCLHIEIQCQRDEHFAERMFVYHALLFAKYRRPVVSLAILGDDSAAWRPCEFRYAFADSALSLRFASCMLLDLALRLPALLATRSGFALFAAAHLETMRTKREPFARMIAKSRLTEILLGFGWDAERTEHMLELLDRLMQLPPAQDRQFRKRVLIKQEANMQTLMERLKGDLRRDMERRHLVKGIALGKRLARIEREEVMEKGRVDGRRLMLSELMEQRFGPLPPYVTERLREAGPAELQRWADRFCEASSLNELLD